VGWLQCETLESNHLELPKGGWGDSRHPDIVSKVHQKGNELLRRQNTFYKGKNTSPSKNYD